MESGVKRSSLPLVCRFILSFLVPAILFLQGCQAGRQVPTDAAMAVPTAWFGEDGERQHRFLPIDTELERFLAGAMENSYSLKAMAMRVRRAEAMHRVVDGGRAPSLSTSFEAEKGEVREGEGQRSASRRYQPALGLSWELDLWGRLADRAEASEREYQATVMDWQAARLSLCARIARGWYQGITAGLLVRQAEDIAASYARTLESVEERYQRGLADALDLYMARTAHSQAQAQLLENRSEAVQTIQELQVLAGHYPDGQLVLPADLPDHPPLPATRGIPAHLAMNRPDLAAMQLRVESADREWSAALKDLLPTLTLSARAGTGAAAIGDSFDPRFGFWQLVAGMTQPLFAGGQLRGRAREAEYGVRQLQLDYCDLLLNGFREVEVALAAEQSLGEQYGQAERTFEHARASWQAALEQYRLGTTDLLTVLVNQRQYLQGRMELIRLRNTKLQNSVDLIAALGAREGFGTVLTAARTPRQHDEEK